MAKGPVKWESDIEGKLYSFSYEKIKSEHLITVNDQQTKLKPSFKSMVLGFDEQFTFDGINARLVVAGNKPDVVVKDIFLQSGKPYLPTPWWAMLFVLPCFVLLITGGFIGGALGALGYMICVYISKRKIPVILKVIINIAIIALCWLIYTVIALFINRYRS